MVYRLDSKVILLVVIISLYWSDWIKSATISDLIFLKVLFKLVMYEPKKLNKIQDMIIAHMNNDLSPRRIFSSHTNSGFYLSKIIDHVVYILDFLWWQIRETFFEFQNFLNFRSWGLSIWMFTLNVRIFFGRLVQDRRWNFHYFYLFSLVVCLNSLVRFIIYNLWSELKHDILPKCFVTIVSFK